MTTKIKAPGIGDQAPARTSTENENDNVKVSVHSHSSHDSLFLSVDSVRALFSLSLATTNEG